MKKPRLFYYEEAVNRYIPAPDKVEEIIDTNSMYEGETTEIRFKCAHMTDEEFDNLPED